MTFAFTLALAALLALGFCTWRMAVAHEATVATKDAEIAEANKGWSQALDLNVAQVRTVETWKGIARKAREDADWNKMIHEITRAELDRVTDRHTVLLSLDGIRADVAEGATYDGPEPPLSIETRANVTPLRGKGGRA